MASIIVKISHGTEIRRFTINNDDALTWATLSKRMAELFELGGPKKFKCTYTDDEGDKVTLSSDAELSEAVGLALTTSPAVLRLSVEVKASTTKTDIATEADVEMSDAASTTDATPTADAGTHAKPVNADAGTDAKPTMADAATNGALPPNAPADMGPFLESLARQLPELMNNLPPGVRNLIPHAELDVAATMAANAAANASCAAAAQHAAAQAAAAAAQAAAGTGGAAGAGCGIHPGVTCDKSGMSPIVGNRYHLVGHNYDLCQAEYDKLNDKEKELYQLVPPPFTHPIPAEGAAAAARAGGGIHPGVECDKSNMCPIVGTRYHLRGHNYDLCQAEYDKLPQTEKLLYTAIPPPGDVAGGAGGAPGNANHWNEKAAAWAAARGWGPGGWGGPGRWGGGGWGGGGWGGRRCGVGGAGPTAAGGPNGGGGMGACGGMGPGGGMGCGPPGPKLAARFVRDVTIFDGTQMAPSTPFTKIWRLKNIGDVPWPPGTRMLFVGGDQMSSEMSVPLTRASAVLPGEEVDVAVEMVAPSELGRYLGYWRLVGPMGRRKFGQRVWCHVQVVDPTMEATVTPSDADLASTLAEIAQKKSAITAHDDDHDDGAGGSADADEEDEEEALAADATSVHAPNGVAAAEKTTVDVTDGAPPAPKKEDEATDEPTDDALLLAEAVVAPSVPSDAADSDDGLLTDHELAEAVAAEPAPPLTADAANGNNGKGAAAATTATATTNKGKAPVAVDDVRTALAAMGFEDAAMLEVVIAKHGADVEACARDLAASTEWDGLLDDLSEMGFNNRELNKSLMLKHNGNIKRTVKELVEDA